ncbi:DUF1592 domain-containing protein [Stieleria sp. TO1_6]|uniref:DUF1592 domain-containing protein n=1 Tax=Stieleria tagensis TaxID=2956795 RepID=UPI00209BA3AF|nr:DUF1592 domain-containing protein [Stieleria tagensis]MCO8124563.1 DUF1592 domain-containing protein [Stieleria tagensis]
MSRINIVLLVAKTLAKSATGRSRSVCRLSGMLPFLLATSLMANERIPTQTLAPFFNQYCADCHGDGANEGEFELDSLVSDLSDRKTFDAWQLVHDRISSGEMPPEDADKPTAVELQQVLTPLASSLTRAQQAVQTEQGRVTARRLNAIEFQTTLSDLLQTPLDIVDLLPTDAKAEGFTTVGSALNVSSVQMEAYLEAIDAAIDQAVRFTERPVTQTFRLSLLNNSGYMLTYRAQHPALPVIDGMNLYATEAMSNHHALWGQYVVPRTGIYRIKVSAYKINTSDPIALTMRVGGNGHKESLKVKHRLLEHFEIESDRPQIHQWQGELLRGHFLHLYPSELPIYRFPVNKGYQQVNWKGPGVCVQWLEIEGPLVETWPPPGEQILFGGVATKSIEGAKNDDPNEQLHSPPIIPADPKTLPSDWPPGGNTWTPLGGRINRNAKFPAREYSRKRSQVVKQILAGKRKGADPLPDYQKPPHNLPIGSVLPSYGGEPIYQNAEHPGALIRTLALEPTNAKADATRLIQRILPLAFRRPVSDDESARYVKFVHQWLDEGVSFESSMRTGYKAIFTSPQFLYHQSTLPKTIAETEYSDEFALAERLAYFLWCSAPDRELMQLANTGKLSQPKILRQQTERLLSDQRSQRFVQDFLGQWLDLYEIDFTSPDTHLYPEYDAVLHTSMLKESQAFFQHLLANDLPARNLVESDVVTINRRLAEHYQIKGVSGMEPTVVKLPDDSVRGGVLTQASVLKVTANGTNTSPVVRGVWVLERVLAAPSPPPPPGIPAVEPDIRGAVTIRQQLEKHRSASHCASCHAKIDPPGVALESFDPVGRYRDHYRILDPAKAELRKQDHTIRYNEGLPVDPSYQLADGKSFKDIRELKQILANDERAIARMLVDRLLVYSTGATTSFADRATIERIVDSATANQFGVRSLVHELIQSELFHSR